MKLTNRLQTIANMVDCTSKVYDVGCDHAYLDIYLASQGFDCIAIDVRKQIVDFAKKNVCNSGFKDKIEVVLNNGLNNIRVEEDSIVILSGLGANHILDIIKNKSINRLIIQSNDNLYLLRKTMMERNYYITDEKIVFEDNKYYVIIKFEIGLKKYEDNELLLGPKLLQNKSNVFIDYLMNMYNHFEKVLLEIPDGYFEKRDEIKKIVEYIKMALK